MLGSGVVAGVVELLGGARGEEEGRRAEATLKRRAVRVSGTHRRLAPPARCVNGHRCRCRSAAHGETTKSIRSHARKEWAQVVSFTIKAKREGWMDRRSIDRWPIHCGWAGRGRL